MSDNTPDGAAARDVRATVDALSAAQPQVDDWPAHVRRLVARRRARRAAAAATGALTVAALMVGAAAALSDGSDELVAGPAPQVSASTTPTSPAAPAASQAPDPSPAAQKLPSCGPAPAPTDGDVVLALRFPERVTASTVGVLRVTNRGQEPVTVSLNDDEAAFAVRDRQIISTGARNSMGQAPTTLAPGEQREVRVRLLSYLCDGNFDRTLPQGSYQVQSTLWLNETTQAVSPPVEILYAAENS